MKDIYSESLDFHKQHRGKIRIESAAPIKGRHDLALAYSPGVAEPCRQISKDTKQVWEYTRRGNMVAVVSDGTAVLGLGDIGPEAALPVMEGKAVLFKEFGGVDAFPLVLNTTDVDEIVQTIKRLESSFGGINLEDISAPRCFEIEERLKQELSIPVFHDDQHGTAIVTLAGLINAAKITSRELTQMRVVLSGSGAAGIAIARLLNHVGISDITLVDSKGIVSNDREDLNPVKTEMLTITNPDNQSGSLADALNGADVFLGVSAPGIVSQDMVRSMAKDPIIFAMANPTPEIMPEEAHAAGAAVVASGRSDYPNQVNNVLAFPGLFRGVLDARKTEITRDMHIAAANALADYVQNPSAENIIPDALDKEVAQVVARAVQDA